MAYFPYIYHISHTGVKTFLQTRASQPDRAFWFTRRAAVAGLVRNEGPGGEGGVLLICSALGAGI
jgi:hypothetical protein